jgi:hypothetical protein
MGGGVPVSLRFVEGRGELPRLPVARTQHLFNRELREDVQALLDSVNAAIKAVNEELPGVSQKKKDAVMQHLEKLQRDVRHNMPFFMKQFGKHMESTVEKGKMELHSYIVGALARAGLESLAGRDMLRLPEGNDDDVR